MFGLPIVGGVLSSVICTRLEGGLIPFTRRGMLFKAFVAT